MLKNLLLLICLSWSINIYAQSDPIDWFYEQNLPDAQASYVTICEELNAGILLGTYNRFITENSVKVETTFTIHDNFTGEIRLKKTLRDSLTLENYQKAIPLNGKNEILVIGYNALNEIIFLTLDSTLEIVSRRRLPTIFQKGLQFVTEYFDNSGNILLAASIYDPLTNYRGGVCYIKLDPNGNILHYEMVEATDGQPFSPCMSIFYDKVNHRYLCTNNPNVELDSNFVYKGIDYQSVNPFVNYRECIYRQMDDDNVLIFGPMYLGSNNQVGANYVLKTDNNFNHKSWAYMGTTAEYALDTGDFVYPDKVYLGATTIQYFFKYLKLAMFDATDKVKKKWEITLMHPNGNYLLDRIKATKDGGVIMYYSRYVGKFVAYALKINSHGQVVHTFGVDEPQLQAIILYGENPSTTGILDIVLSRGLKQGSIAVLSMQGQQVHQAALNNSDRQTVDLSHLPAGSYVVQIAEEGKQIGALQWVKL